MHTEMKIYGGHIEGDGYLLIQNTSTLGSFVKSTLRSLINRGYAY